MAAPAAENDPVDGGAASQTTENQQQPAALAWKPSESDAQTQGESDSLTLDALGPVILNSDGSVSRIPNWGQLTDAEREKTFRLISKRNAARRKQLEAAAAEERP
jgi:hypothetical protein